MEDCFTPSRRRQERHGNMFAGYTEVKLTVSIEAFMNHRWDWSDFQAFVTGDEGERWKVLWITENTCICVEDEDTFFGYDEEDYAILRASFTTTSGERYDMVLAMKGTDTASLSAEASCVFWHAVTTSNCVKLKLHHMCCWFGLYSGPALSQFLEASPSLELLEFESVTFEEASCRALATLERTDLEITFNGCSFDPGGAKDTVIEWFRRSQVVTKLERCRMNDSIISALSENTSVKIFSIIGTTDGHSDLALVLAGNKGIENLHLPWFTDETWGDETRSLLLDSLWEHPRIQSVSLYFYSRLSAASKASIMIAAVRRLVRYNTVVRTIKIEPDGAYDEEFFQNFISPRLEMNRSCFEDQRQALTRADPSVRGWLLCRALRAVHFNPDLLFRFLSENVPAFVRSDEEDNIIP
jgi:hypothetical protein